MEEKVIYKIYQVKFKQVLADKTIPPGAKLVLFNLIHRLGLKNYAFPSQRTIGIDIGLGERQVRNHLRLLAKKGVVKWDRGAKNPKTGKKLNSNKYDLSSILLKKSI